MRSMLNGVIILGDSNVLMMNENELTIVVWFEMGD